MNETDAPTLQACTCYVSYVLQREDVESVLENYMDQPDTPVTPEMLDDVRRALESWGGDWQDVIHAALTLHLEELEKTREETPTS